MVSFGQIDKVGSDIRQLEARVQSRLHGRVRSLRLQLRDTGLVLAGQAATYYAKQIAQHAVMQLSELPILANDIEVA
ncbi:MAG: hypothetical protein FJ271_17685 [Planctomycetes bacterium]|nr:hypothetical protein [Planctomycetota bacterium]